MNPIRGFANVTTAVYSSSGGLASTARAVGSGIAGGAAVIVVEESDE
ncbi:MAG: hypothetical protein GJ680_06045 [Alteromonadaceae bacterium]|nr:hypothetical protein [Alteromonadaceae bacterium]